jgi:maltodextrin utilization protein YvdJ
MSQSAPLIRRELKQILPNLNPEQRQAIADQLIKQLREQGIEQKTLEYKLTINTTDPKAMNVEDISQVATYAYEHYPEVFEAVLTQPNIVQFLSHPVLSAIVGIMAAKWLNQ